MICMPAKASSSITYSVRLTTRTDGRVNIIGSKEVRMLLSSLGYPLRMTLLLRASNGKIVLAKSAEALYDAMTDVSAEITPEKV